MQPIKAEWFAARLRELRTAAGLSRKELADRAGFQSEAGVRNLEQGIRKPAWETVVALCEALGVGCDAFLQPPAEADAGKATGDYGLVSDGRSRPAAEGKASDAKPRRRGRPRKGR